jgi:hypothetical protein
MNKTDQHRQASDTTRLILAALVVAVTLLLLFGVVMMLLPEGYKINWKWMRVSVPPIVLAVTTIRAYRQLHKRIVFWTILAIVLVVHICAAVYFFDFVTALPTSLFAAMFSLEGMALALVIYRAFGVGPRLRPIRF